MKKVIVFALLAVAGAYLVGRTKLSERAAGDLLGDLDVKMFDGETEGLCDPLHDDLEVSITASMGGEETHIDGGREEFCEFLTTGAQGMPLLLAARAKIEVRRTDFEVQRSWAHPWTAHYTYIEESSIRIPGAGVSLDFESEAAATLVMTFGGVKLLKLESEQL